jgi:hypothetical protein
MYPTSWNIVIFTKRGSPVSQEISSNLWNPKVYYRLHNSRLVLPVLNQINPHRNHPSYSIRNYFIFIQISSNFEVLQFPPPKSCTRVSSAHACRLSHPSHRPSFYYIDNICQGIKSVMIFIMEFYTTRLRVYTGRQIIFSLF